MPVNHICYAPSVFYCTLVPSMFYCTVAPIMFYCTLVPSMFYCTLVPSMFYWTLGPGVFYCTVAPSVFYCTLVPPAGISYERRAAEVSAVGRARYASLHELLAVASFTTRLIYMSAEANSDACYT